MIAARLALFFLGAGVAGAGVDPGWLEAVHRSISDEELRVGAENAEGTFPALNRKQGFRAFFDEDRVRIAPDRDDSWTWSLRWIGYGRPGAVRPVPEAVRHADGNRIEYLRGNLLEWYVNEPRGVKQGFVVDEPPGEGRLLHLELVLGGDLSPVVAADGRSIVFRAPAGERVLRYHELLVTDAAGNTLEAWMEGSAGTERIVRLVVDADDAVFPVTIDPLASTPDWVAEGTFAGRAVSGGDVNGDGYSDLLVSKAGFLYVFHGSASGPGVAPSTTIEQAGGGRAAGDVNGDGFGDVIASGGTRIHTYHGSAAGLPTLPSTVSAPQSGQVGGTAAGDVNGDGYADVVVRVNGGTDQPGEGRAQVYLGSPSGLASTPVWEVEGNQSFAGLGSVSTAGDVNGDGFSDVLIGAAGFDNGEDAEGRAYVFHGSPAGPQLQPSWTAEGNFEGAFFGSAVSTTGDVNGDGYADIIIGSSSFSLSELSTEGKVWVYHGSAQGVEPLPVLEILGPTFEVRFGASVYVAGDVNGDGYADVLVTASGETPQDAFVALYSGSEIGLDASPDWMAEGTRYTGETAGDVNGDGFSDVLLGSTSGSVLYLGGPDGPKIAADWSTEGQQPEAGLGHAVGSAGDVDGDGFEDLLVSTPGFDDVGRVDVFPGGPAGVATDASWTVYGSQPFAELGFSADGAGDVNGDGYADVIVGAPGTSNGSVYVYSGSPTGLGVSPSWSRPGDEANARFGESVSSAGDVDGDGFSDVIVGAPGTANGTAYLFHGSGNGPVIPAARTLSGASVGGRFGAAVSDAGDVDRDGRSDVIVGAPEHANGELEEGGVYLFRGSAFGLEEIATWSLESDTVGGNLGASVAGAGDTDGDGYSDVIVGVPGIQGGEVRVYFGSPSGPGDMWAVAEAAPGAGLGESVAGAGDVNGDGLADVIAGAPGFPPGGQARLFFGSAVGPSPSADRVFSGTQSGSGFGSTVASAGDANGDGYSEVVVGADAFSGGEGGAFLYYGNGSRGVSVEPQQRRANNFAPVVRALQSDRRDAFALTARGRTPFGPGRVKLQWEVKPRGVPLDGVATGESSWWHFTGAAGVPMIELVDGLTPGVDYHWRARFLYDSSMIPFAPASRWFTQPTGGWNEAAISTRATADIWVTQIDTPDPLSVPGGSITYEIWVGNSGPDPAETVLLDSLPVGSSLVSVTPSQGSCGHDAGVVTCELGLLPSGSTAIIDLVVGPTDPGIYVNSAWAYGSESDTDPGDNFSTEETTVDYDLCFGGPSHGVGCVVEGDCAPGGRCLEPVEIEWTPVGNPRNAGDPDNDSLGAVDDGYFMSAYEVTNDQYVAFLSSVASTDPNALFVPAMESDPRGGIVRAGGPGSYTYAAKANMGDKPVNHVSYLSAMRFVNWIENGMPGGAQDASTTEDGTYTLGNGTDEVRAPEAHHFLPDGNEWFKAGFHHPWILGGTQSDFHLEITGPGPDPVPALAGPTGDIANPGERVVNYQLAADWNGQDGNVTTVGSAGPLGATFYGTFDQGGNVAEWTETVSGADRTIRGGSYASDVSALISLSHSQPASPGTTSSEIGFRIARGCYGQVTAGDRDADGICDDVDLCAGSNASGDANGNGVCDGDENEVRARVRSLEFSRLASQDGFRLSWNWDLCGWPEDSTDYSVYEGNLDGDFDDHVPITCGTYGGLSYVLDPGPGSKYYLVVPHAFVTEGSHGLDSSGTPRPQGPDPCRARGASCY